MESSLHSPKFTLVPAQFFDEAQSRGILSEVALLDEADTVSHIEIPQYSAVLVYVSGGEGLLPEMFYILRDLQKCTEYNKILCSRADGRLFLAIAQGRTLLLANSYPAPDFTTAEYYIFLALKSLQLNPEISTVSWRSGLSGEEEMSLYHYFKAVEQL